MDSEIETVSLKTNERFSKINQAVTNTKKYFDQNNEDY